MRGMEWITKMVMEMVLVLAVVLMETPEGGWRRHPEVISAAFPPPIFSGGSLLSLCFWFFVSPPPPRMNLEKLGRLFFRRDGVVLKSPE